MFAVQPKSGSNFGSVKRHPIRTDLVREMSVCYHADYFSVWSRIVKDRSVESTDNIGFYEPNKQSSSRISMSRSLLKEKKRGKRTRPRPFD